MKTTFCFGLEIFEEGKDRKTVYWRTDAKDYNTAIHALAKYRKLEYPNAMFKVIWFEIS